MRASTARRPAPSILDAPVSRIHRIDDVKPSTPMSLWPTLELDARQPAPARHAPQSSQSAEGVSIKAEINLGSVDFRVSGKDSAVTFEELEAACREQLPGVVLERRTKWLQYTFDLWAHAGQCLYSIPIASIEEPQPSAPPGRKVRRHPAELAPHHPRG